MEKNKNGRIGKPRQVRMSDELWEDLGRLAVARGLETASLLIRRDMSLQVEETKKSDDLRQS